MIITEEFNKSTFEVFNITNTHNNTNKDSIRIIDICRDTGLIYCTVAKNIKLLEIYGLIIRKKYDGRTHIIELTDKGRMFGQLLDGMNNLLNEMKEKWIFTILSINIRVLNAKELFIVWKDKEQKEFVLIVKWVRGKNEKSRYERNRFF